MSPSFLLVSELEDWVCYTLNICFKLHLDFSQESCIKLWKRDYCPSLFQVRRSLVSQAIPLGLCCMHPFMTICSMVTWTQMHTFSKCQEPCFLWAFYCTIHFFFALRFVFLTCTFLGGLNLRLGSKMHDSTDMQVLVCVYSGGPSALNTYFPQLLSLWLVTSSTYLRHGVPCNYYRCIVIFVSVSQSFRCILFHNSQGQNLGTISLVWPPNLVRVFTQYATLELALFPSMRT